MNHSNFIYYILTFEIRIWKETDKKDRLNFLHFFYVKEYASKNILFYYPIFFIIFCFIMVTLYLYILSCGYLHCTYIFDSVINYLCWICYPLNIL